MLLSELLDHLRPGSELLISGQTIRIVRTRGNLDVVIEEDLAGLRKPLIDLHSTQVEEEGELGVGLVQSYGKEDVVGEGTWPATSSSELGEVLDVVLVDELDEVVELFERTFAGDVIVSIPVDVGVDVGFRVNVMRVGARESEMSLILAIELCWVGRPAAEDGPGQRVVELITNLALHLVHWV